MFIAATFFRQQAEPPMLTPNFQRALALDPGNPAAKAALAALPQTLH